jgi:hypothetical protein
MGLVPSRIAKKPQPTTATAASVSCFRGRRNQMRPGGALVTKDNPEGHLMRMSARIMSGLMTYQFFKAAII